MLVLLSLRWYTITWPSPEVRLHEHPLLSLRRTAPHWSKGLPRLRPSTDCHRDAHPVPAQGRVSILAIALYAFAFVLCAFGTLWVVAYASEHYESAKAERSASSANAMHATAVQHNASLGGIHHQLEEKVEQDLWYKPRELRGWRETMAERLAQKSAGPARRSGRTL